MVTVSATISICVTGEHLVDYIPFLQSGAIPGLSPIVIKKVTLAHSPAQHLPTICGCFPIAPAELDSCNRDHIAQTDKNIYYLTLCRSSLLIPGSGHRKGETLL